MIDLNYFKIKLWSEDQVIRFVNKCDKYKNDITVYDGSLEIDAKSLLGMMLIDTRKYLGVSINTSDKSEIEFFKFDMVEFIVKEV